MNGRGRGVSNKPAWMTSGEDANGGVGAGNRGTAAAPPPVGLPPPSLGRDQPIPRGGPPPSSRGPPPPRGGPRGGGGRDRDRNGGRGPVGVVRFRSWEHERDWVEDRRRRRRERRSKFDVEPTPEQMERERMREAALATTAASTGGAAMIGPSGGGGFNVAVQPQQTRHARRLYIGNIPVSFWSSFYVCAYMIRALVNAVSHIFVHPISTSHNIRSYHHRMVSLTTSSAASFMTPSPGLSAIPGPMPLTIPSSTCISTRSVALRSSSLRRWK